MDLVRTSKRLSRVLRHQPGSIGVTLSPDGWIDIDVLLDALARHGTPLTRADLDRVVAGNDKQRFAVDGTRIRASQGHSVPVELGYEPADAPPVLFHGTAVGNLAAIRAEGLHRGRRHHVHLSADVATAARVGARHGKPVVLTVDAAAMAAAGHVFFRSANGVWLTEAVPARYLGGFSEA